MLRSLRENEGLRSEDLFLSDGRRPARIDDRALMGSSTRVPSRHGSILVVVVDVAHSCHRKASCIAFVLWYKGRIEKNASFGSESEGTFSSGCVWGNVYVVALHPVAMPSKPSCSFVPTHQTWIDMWTWQRAFLSRNKEKEWIPLPCPVDSVALNHERVAVVGRATGAFSEQLCFLP